MTTRDEQGPIRTDIELIRAHDLLTGILRDADLRAAVFGDNESLLVSATHAANALCWVLNHEHNPRFGILLSDLERRMARLGYGLVVEE